jgi:hypothetical protein
VAGDCRAQSQHILSEELQKRGWDLEGLKQRRKGDPDKIQIARRLRARTSMTLVQESQPMNSMRLCDPVMPIKNLPLQIAPCVYNL